MNTATFQHIPLECIRVSITNPRKHFNEALLAELAESIRQHGVAQPILVRPVAHDIIDQSPVRFEIVAGERRYRASGLAGYVTVPAIVRVLDDVQTLEIQVIENLQRADLHPLEEAEGYEQLMKAHHYTAEQLADKVGKSKAFIYARLKLCALVPEARKAFYDGLLTPSTAILVARIPVKLLQAKAVKEITQPMWNGDLISTRRAQEHIQKVYMLQIKDAPFKANDANLHPSAGTCAACPKRTGNQPELFTDVGSADVCTDPTCFSQKREAHMNRLKDAASAKGQTIISGPEAKKIKPHEYTCSLSNGYIDLSAKCYDDAENRTYRQILGKSAPQPILLENPHADNLIEIVRVADVALLLEEQGIAKPGSSNEQSRIEEKKLEAKIKLEREYRRRLFTAVHEKSNSALDKQDLRAIAAVLYRQCPDAERPLIHAMYGWDKSIDEHPYAEKRQAAIASLDGKQAAQLILDLVLVRDLTVNTYNIDREKPQQLLAAAKRAGVDPEPIKAEVNLVSAPPTNDMTLRSIIADDAYSATFQSLEQYRAALLASLDTMEGK